MERSIEVIEKNPKIDTTLKIKLINDLKKAFEVHPEDKIGQISFRE